MSDIQKAQATQVKNIEWRTGKAQMLFQLCVYGTIMKFASVNISFTQK